MKLMIIESDKKNISSPLKAMLKASSPQFIKSFEIVIMKLIIFLALVSLSAFFVDAQQQQSN